MRTPTLFFLIVLGMVYVGITDGHAATDSLKLLGHASVKIRTAQGTIIYIDPYAPGDYADSADILLVTHGHGDHNAIGLVKRKTGSTYITNIQAVQGGVYQKFTIGTITVDAVPAYNTNHPKGTAVGYVLEFNGIRLYHAGDTDNIPEMADLATRKITYALLPMDGVYNMGPEQATLAAGAIKARSYIPIHTMPPPDTVSDAIIARFTVANKIIMKNGQSIGLSSDATSSGDQRTQPLVWRLEQNYPNPFNPKTTIRYQLSAVSEVRVGVYNLLGEEVSRLVNEKQNPGVYTVIFDASGFTSGLYIYRLTAGEGAVAKKMVFVK